MGSQRATILLSSVKGNDLVHRLLSKRISSIDGDSVLTDLASLKDLPEYCCYYKDSDSQPKHENVPPLLVFDLIHKLRY